MQNGVVEDSRPSDRLLALPLELKLRIFSFLPATEILALQLLSRAYRQIDLVPLALTQLERHDVEDAAHVPTLAARIATFQAHRQGRPQALYQMQVPRSTRSLHMLRGKLFAYPSEGGITIVDLTTQAVSHVPAQFEHLILTTQLVAWIDGDVLKYAHLSNLDRIQEHDVRGLYIKERYPRECCSSIAGYGLTIGMVNAERLTLIEGGRVDIIELPVLEGYRNPTLCMSKDTCVVIRPRQSVQSLSDRFIVAHVMVVHRGSKSDFLLTCTASPDHFDRNMVVLPAGWEHTWHIAFGRTRRELATTILLYAHATHDFQECEGPHCSHVWKGYHYSHTQLGIGISAYTTQARPQRLLHRDQPSMIKAHPPVNETFLIDASTLRKGELSVFLFDPTAVITCQLEPLPFVSIEDIKSADWDHCWTAV